MFFSGGEKLGEERERRKRKKEERKKRKRKKKEKDKETKRKKEGGKEGKKKIATKEGQGSLGQHWNLGQASRQKNKRTKEQKAGLHDAVKGPTIPHTQRGKKERKKNK